MSRIKITIAPLMEEKIHNGEPTVYSGSRIVGIVPDPSHPEGWKQLVVCQDQCLGVNCPESIHCLHFEKTSQENSV